MQEPITEQSQFPQLEIKTEQPRRVADLLLQKIQHAAGGTEIKRNDELTMLADTLFRIINFPENPEESNRFNPRLRTFLTWREQEGKKDYFLEELMKIYGGYQLLAEDKGNIGEKMAKAFFSRLKGQKPPEDDSISQLDEKDKTLLLATEKTGNLLRDYLNDPNNPEKKDRLKRGLNELDELLEKLRGKSEEINEFDLQRLRIKDNENLPSPLNRTGAKLADQIICTHFPPAHIIPFFNKEGKIDDEAIKAFLNLRPNDLLSKKEEKIINPIFAIDLTREDDPKQSLILQEMILQQFLGKPDENIPTTPLPNKKEWDEFKSGFIERTTYRMSKYNIPNEVRIKAEKFLSDALKSVEERLFKIKPDSLVLDNRQIKQNPSKTQ